MVHGHEVLLMMEGNSYSSEKELIDCIIQKFGLEEQFYTCSKDNMTADELVAFLREKGKFKSSSKGGFTVDMSKICHH